MISLNLIYAKLTMGLCVISDLLLIALKYLQGITSASVIWESLVLNLLFCGVPLSKMLVHIFP